MKFRVHIDGVEHQVEATVDGALLLDGEPFRAKVNGPSDDRRTVQLGSKTYDVRVVENCIDTGLVVLELAGERISLSVSGVEKGARRGGSTGSEGSAASLPGGAGVSGGARAAAGAPANAMGSSGALADVASSAGRAGIEPAGSASGGQMEAGEAKDGIWAPVPGRIVDVFVKPGDVIEEGAPVLILEAMKMENELHAPHRGTVAAVMVKKGDQAEKGQLLIVFA